MKKILPLACLGFIALGTGAYAASPDYCALYSREYAKEYARLSGKDSAPDAAQHIQDRAFYKCLNLDEDPALPSASAYVDIGDEQVAEADTEGALAEGDAADQDITPDTDAPAATAVAPEPKAEPAKKVTKTASVAKSTHRGSGLKAWSPEWKAWCQKHFPNSFDPETGYILPYEGEKMLCK